MSMKGRKFLKAAWTKRMKSGMVHRTQTLLGLGLLALAVTMIGAASASASVSPLEVSEYRETFEVSKAEAEENLETQSDATAAELPSQIESRLGSSYAGIWFDNETGEYVVPLLSDAAGAGVASEFAEADLGAEQFRTTPAQFSWADLEAAQEGLNKALVSQIEKGMVQTSVDPRTNSVVIKLASDVPADEEADVRQAAAEASVEVDVRASGLEKLEAKLEACKDPFCDAPLRGGVAIYPPGFPEAECTAAFPAVGTNGDRYLLTAGHCVHQTGVGTPTYLNWTSADSSLQAHEIGSATQWASGGATEWAKIKANGSWWDSGSWPAQIAYWGTAKVGPSGEFLGKGAPVDLNYAITGQGTNVKGNFVCRSGIMTGSSCGFIEATNVTYNAPGGPINNLVELGGAGVCSIPGDSGAPYFSGHSALGIHVGSSESKACGDRLYYVDINLATAALGVTVAPPAPKVTIQQSTALNGNPGWATVTGTVSVPNVTVNGKTVNIKFFKWNVSTTKWDEKAVVPTAVNNNKFELVNWNGVGNGSWIAQAVFPAQGPFGAGESNTVTEGAFLVKDGYRFKVKHTEKCLDVYAGLTANGTAINQWDCLNPATTSNQVFTMVPTGSNGAVRIVARHSNRCVSVKGGSTAPGTYLEQYDCAGGEQPGQTWRTEKMTGNWSRLIAKHSNQCMDVRGQETANGVPVTQYTCLGTQANQMWEIQSVDAGPIPTQTELYVPDGETLYGRPYGYSTAYGYVRTGAYNIAGNTLKLSYYKQNGAGNYEYIKAVNPTINSEGRFEVKYEGFGPGEWIVKADFPGVGNFAASGSPERWFHVGDGYRYVFRHSGKCLTLNGNYNYNGNIFVQWDCAPVATPYDGQVFAMHPIEGGARFNITVNSTGKCLDVTGGSTANGAAFQQYDCNGSDQQRFQVIPIYMQPPWNALIAKHSNKCMDVYSQYTSNGALIHQWECLWPGSQQWQFQRIG